jgi:Flp pilus assembly protein TadD
MAHLKRGSWPAAARGLSGLTATLMLGACAQTAEILPSANLAATEQTDDAGDSKYPQNELQKATTYWGKEYAKRPSELEPALNYARNLKALGEKQKALTVLQHAASYNDGNKELAGEYGRLALDLDQVGVAARMLEVADDPAKPDWKVISARGTVLAKQGQYKQAIPFYERALALSANQPSVLNNLAMAHAMSGDPKQAEVLLRQASANPGGDTSKVKQNLALVVGLQGRYDEAKSLTAGTATAMAGSENADMVRSIVKIDPKSAASAAPSALAAAPVPDFKTQVSRAIATSPGKPGTTPVAMTPAALKPAAVETAAAAWQPEVVASTASSSGLKGSSR